MPRPKGSKVKKCECGLRVVGMPGKKVTCKRCKKRVYFPREKTAW